MVSVSRVFRYDITIYQGMDEYFPMRIQGRNATIPDLAEWSATFRLYKAPATLDSLHDEAPVLVGTSSGGRVMLGLFDGGDFGQYNVLLTLTSALTSTLQPWGRGVYFLDIIDPYGHVQYRVRGTVALEEGTKHG